MPIDRSSIAFVDSSAEVSIGTASYERYQVFRSIWIHCSHWRREVIDSGLRPNWLSRTPNSAIANGWWCLAAANGACEFSCIATIEVGSGHVGAHECRPCTDRRITDRKGRTRCHERRSVVQMYSLSHQSVRSIERRLPFGRLRGDRSIWFSLHSNSCPLPECFPPSCHRQHRH